METHKRTWWLNYLEPCEVKLKRIPLTPFRVEVIHWRVIRTFTRFVHGHAVTVPEGFETDLASVPAVLWWYYTPHGPYVLDSVVHDYLYEGRKLPRRVADTIYLELLKRNPRVSKGTAWAHYIAVRLGGWKAYVTD